MPPKRRLAHKLICWKDYSIPVPIGTKWMAWDDNGAVYVFFCTKKPTLDYEFKVWLSASKSEYDAILPDIVSFCKDIPPPEPGPWDTQLYWIGD